MKNNKRFRFGSLFSRILLTMVLLFIVMCGIVFWYWESRIVQRIRIAEQTKADLLTTASTPSIV